MTDTGNGQSADSNSYPDWASIYNNIQQSAQIPGVSSDVITQNDAVIRDLYVDLSDVHNKITASEFTPFLITIYADVVHIPQNFSWVLSGAGLVIAARRIEVVGSAQVILDYRQTQTATLVMYTNELVGSLQAVAVTSTSLQSQPQTFSVGPITAKGVQLAYLNGAPVRNDLAVLQGPMLADGSDFQLSLVSIFQFATVLFDTQPTMVNDMLEWIKDCTSQSSATTGLFLQSSSLQALLNATSTATAGGAAFVPYLSKNLYTNLAAAFVAEAEAYETQYERFSDQNQAIEDRIAAAKVMLGNVQDNTGYVNQLIAQCKGNLANANQAVFTAQNNLHSQQNTVEQAANTFQAGMVSYEYEQKLEAAYTLVMSVVTFGAAIAGMLAGVEVAGPAAAGSAIASADGVAHAADAGAQTAKTASDLAKIMKLIQQTVEALEKTYTFANQIATAAGDISSAGSMVKGIAQMDVSTNGADLSASDYWQIFKLTADSALKDAVDNKIAGASDYQLQLDTLTVYGQSLAASQLVVVQTSQELVRLNLQKQVSQQQQARLSDYVNGLSASEQPNAAMMQMFYQRYLDAKRSLFVALENYKLSYQYWALCESRVNPSITDNVGQLSSGLTSLTAIQMDDAQALAAFSPAPESFPRMTCIISDPQVLQSLQQTGKASWPIDLDNPSFAGLDRVRATTVRVWLEGAKPQGFTPIYLNISNSGNYRDRLKTQNYQFTAQPLQLVFKYEATSQEQGGVSDWRFANGQYGYVNVDGRVDDEVQYAYFVPTVFSDWTISVPTAFNQGIDLSGVTQITMEFAGSVIGETTNSMGSAAGATATH